MEKSSADLHAQSEEVIEEVEQWVFDPDGEWRFIEGLYYWEDENHFGKFFLTEAMVEKHNLKGIAVRLEDDLDDWDGTGWSEEIENNGFTHLLTIDHCAGVSKGNTEDDWMTCKQDTPHGQVWSKEFVSWWCEVPMAFFDDADDENEPQVLMIGWADG